MGLQLKKQYKTMSCKDMQQGDIAIITHSSADNSQKGMVILRAYQNYVDISSGDYYGDISTNVHPISNENYPDWSVELIEPGTILVVE